MAKGKDRGPMSMLAEIRCPLVLAGAGPRTEAQTQLIDCSLVGSHKFKPKSQYKLLKPLYKRTPYTRTH